MDLILLTTWCFKQFNRVELYTELMKSSPRILVPSITQQFEQFGWFQPTQTHKKIILRPSFLRLLSSSSSLAVLNFLELKENCSFLLVSLITHQFKQFSFFDHFEHMRNFPLILFLLIPVQFKQFGGIELSRTHEIFSYDTFI